MNAPSSSGTGPTRRGFPWATFWAAVGAVAAVAAIIVGLLSQRAPDNPPPPPTSPPTASPAGSIATTQPSAAIGTIIVQPGNVAQVFATPSTIAAVVSTLSNGTSVRIICTVQSEVVTANNSSSSLWDRIEIGYVPDVNIYTGTNEPTMPSCSR